ncbi:MAG: ATP-binding protein [Acidobacteriota bacterium]|nr:ATP-binding protein [Acidobacteriota bacterium]
MNGEISERILVAAPTGRDAELICAQLGANGLRAEKAANAVAVAEAIATGVGAIVLTEEALAADGLSALSRALTQQPAWSEVPLILLTGEASQTSRSRTVEGLEGRTNITLIDRPVRIKALVSAAQSALRARQRQYEIRDLMVQLENRLHERDKFLAILGHELRNPLSAILLASQMTAGDGKLDNEHARLIERQSRHLTQLVNDLLDLSRVVTGKIILKPRVIDLREVASQSLRTVQSSTQAQKLDIRMSLSEEPVRIYGDPVRVDQILNNLLTNAVKYTPAGGHINIRIEADDRQAVIRVEDDGVGIAPNRLDGIFEMFAQLDNAIGRAQGGMGIGLALVRNLVNLHGGTVRAKSEGPGKGSEFVVTLPLAAADIAVEQEVSAPAPDKTSTAARRIVIIEDNADVRDLLVLKLSRLGHEVTGVGNGVEGLQAVIDAEPDLALIDLGLPGLDGFGVAEQVRKQLGDSVVLVAVSGFGQPDDKRRAIESGFDEHITKPADVHDIESLLSRFPPRNSKSEAVL